MSNITYRNCKTLIQAGRYVYEDMYNKLDLFLLVGRITDEEYIELSGMMVPPAPVPEDPQEAAS